MGDFIYWLFNSFVDTFTIFAGETTEFISYIFEVYYSGDNDLRQINFNLLLFSDTPILSTNVFDFLLLFFTIFYTIVFVVIVWKIIKKVVVKITGWNRW